MDTATVQAGLERFLRDRSGAKSVAISNLSRLSGGASRETWTFDADLVTPAGSERLEAIFRADPGEGMASPGRALEYTAIKAAWENGVRTPEPLWDGDDELFGLSFSA